MLTWQNIYETPSGTFTIREPIKQEDRNEYYQGPKRNWNN